MGSLVSIFTVGINSESFPWPVHPIQETLPPPKFSVMTVDGTVWHINLTQAMMN